MEGENTSPKNSTNFCMIKEFKDNLHSGIQRSKMELPKHKNCNIEKVARALMAKRNLPRVYRAETINIAVYIMNKSPTTAIHNATLEENYTAK